MKTRLFLLSTAALCTVSLSAPVWAGVYSSAVAGGPSALLVSAAMDSKAIEGARGFIDGIAQRGIGFLSNESLNQDQRRKEFKKLLKDSFDMKTIGRFALGTYWRTATDAQKAEYQRLFENMIVNVYSNRFNDYKGQKLEVKEARPEGDRDAIVTSYIIPESGENIQVDWRVRYKDGQYKIVDVIVAGVSMAVTQRSDFSSVIQRGGGQVEALLVSMRQ